MRKHLFTFILCLALLVTLLPPAISGAADERISFISINDTLPPELINTAVIYGGQTYVPYWLFTSYGLGIYYSYFTGNSTAYLFNADKQIFFELTTGKTYDGDDYFYSAPAILRGGTVYLPLNFTCSFFDLLYTSAGGNEYGTILRITNGAAMLTDAELLRYGRSVMRTYYQSYNKPGTDSQPGTDPQPGETPKPNAGRTVLLGLTGLPSEELLRTLQQMQMNACFFLTAEEIQSQPDMVRRLACQGFGLGLNAMDAEGPAPGETARLLWETARVRVALTLLPAEGETPPDAAVFRAQIDTLTWDGGPDRWAYGAMDALRAGGNTSLLLRCDGENEVALRMVLNHLREEGYIVTAPREIDTLA